MKGLEKLQREITVHGRIFHCELAEVRLASEEILSKPSFTPTTDEILKLTLTDVLVAISGEEDAMNKLNALLIACEFLGEMGYWTGGSIDYHNAINQRRQKKSSTLFIHNRCTFPEETPRGGGRSDRSVPIFRLLSSMSSRSSETFGVEARLERFRAHHRGHQRQHRRPHMKPQDIKLKEAREANQKREEQWSRPSLL